MSTLFSRRIIILKALKEYLSKNGLTTELRIKREDGGGDRVYLKCVFREVTFAVSLDNAHLIVLSHRACAYIPLADPELFEKARQVCYK